MTSNMPVPFMRHMPTTHVFSVELNRFPSIARTHKPLITVARKRPMISLVKGEGLIMPEPVNMPKPVRPKAKPVRKSRKAKVDKLVEQIVADALTAFAAGAIVMDDDGASVTV